MSLLPAPAHPKRLAYLGTPAVGVPPLIALHEAGFDVPLVISRPDKRRGRGGALTPSPVKAAAIDLGLPVADHLDALDGVDVDLGVVVAYGRIIPTALLERLPMVNLHFSLLPRWRGAAPVERAILAGDTQTGVCLMAVAPELDTGDVFRCVEVGIERGEMLDDLRARLVDAGAGLLVDSLSAGLAPPTPQVGEPTYAAKIEPDEHRLDFTRSADELHRVVRLGRAWCLFRNKRLKVTAARTADAAGCPPERATAPGQLRGSLVTTGEGVLELIEVQPEGKKPMAVDAWLNGVQPEPGERLG